MTKPHLFLLAVLLLGSASKALPETNLVSNQGFEQPAIPDGLPGAGWWLYRGPGDTKATVDQTVFHTGKASVKLQASTKAKSVLVSAPFAIAPRSEERRV